MSNAWRKLLRRAKSWNLETICQIRRLENLGACILGFTSSWIGLLNLSPFIYMQRRKISGFQNLLTSNTVTWSLHQGDDVCTSLQNCGPGLQNRDSTPLPLKTISNLMSGACRHTLGGVLVTTG